MKRRRRPVATLPRCVLDSGGLSALVGISLRARTWLRWIVEHDGTVEVPTVVLVETTTADGGRDAEINRVLRVLSQSAAALVSADEATARRAGQLRFRAGTDDGIDALVAATAVRDGSPCVLLTSDAGDLKRLLVGANQVAVRPV